MTDKTISETTETPSEKKELTLETLEQRVDFLETFIRRHSCLHQGDSSFKENALFGLQVVLVILGFMLGAIMVITAMFWTLARVIPYLEESGWSDYILNKNRPYRNYK